MNRKHILYATSALLLVGGGTLSVIKLTSDSADKTDNAITVEATTAHDDITTETVAEASTETQSASDKDDRKKDDNNTTTASTAEISSNISSEGNGNQTVSSGNNGTTAPSGNGSSSGNGNSSGNGSSTGGGSSSGGNGSSTGNGSSGNGGSTGNGNGGSTGGGNPSGPVAPVHTHDWQPVYKTIHHDEVSHMEKVLVKDAWDEEVYEKGYRHNDCGYAFPVSSVTIVEGSLGICPNCGFEVADFSSCRVQTGTIHHDAVYEDKKIIDQTAYDEQVIDYYKCSCGETKK